MRVGADRAVVGNNPKNSLGLLTYLGIRLYFGLRRIDLRILVGSGIGLRRLSLRTTACGDGPKETDEKHCLGASQDFLSMLDSATRTFISLGAISGVRFQ